MLLTSALVCAVLGRAVPHNILSSADEVTSLPGWDGPLTSRLFSGYLNITATKHIHYIFVESEKNPSTDPVVLWLNGGPGCSSLGGFLYEHGPYIIDPTDYTRLIQRPIRWTQVANMLFFEAPVGVGFSYSDDPSEYACNDDQTAQDNLLAVETFFATYPEFRSNEFYITGESYAGIYVPTLAEAIMKASDTDSYTGAPLKGIGVGNGCSGHEIGICGFSNQGTYYEYKFLLNQAFISQDLKNVVNKLCNWTDAAHNRPLSDDCNSALSTAATQIGHINLYNIYGDCVGSGDHGSDGGIRHAKAPHHSALKLGGNLGGPDACIDSRAASAYLNRDDVMKALHVQRPGFYWGVCTTAPGWSYNSTRPNLPRDTYPALVKRYRVLIYNGDWDACVPYTDNEAWTESMGFRVSNPWHPWTYTTADGTVGQVGGYAVKYEIPAAGDDSWFRFITVRGGRHEVPESAPDKALEMLSRLIHNLDF